jgi:hypothetical protein
MLRTTSEVVLLLYLLANLPSVADPGSGAVLTPRIRDNFSPELGSRILISESYLTLFKIQIKYFISLSIGPNFFMYLV